MKPNVVTKSSIFATFIVCCAIAALLCSALATDYWVTSTAINRNKTEFSGEVNLGLFNGKKVLENDLAKRSYDRKVVCMTDRNICMFSCGSSSEDRHADLEDLVLHNGTTFDDDKKCQSTVVQGWLAEGPAPPLVRAQSDGLITRLLRVPAKLQLDDDDQIDEDDLFVTEIPRKEPQFMVYGLWLSTIVMMGAAIAFVLVAAMFAILNTATNPVETLTGVVGLYLWNGIAMFFEFMALALWGAQFHKRLQHSVLWRDEMTQQWSTDGKASLGYSYWLVFVAMILHGVNMAILWFGTHQKQPKKVQIPVERGNANAVNMIY